MGKTKEPNEEICECGHHTKDHSYNPNVNDDNLHCDKCPCDNFKKK